MSKIQFEELVKNTQWGFLREDQEDADKAGVDEDTGLHRTSLLDYLNIIYPQITDWVHDKTIPGSKRKFKPDYRSESLKLIVEFDGFPHYQYPDTILGDDKKGEFYQSLGYKVVRIPYFIQLSNAVVKKLFDKDVQQPLFDERIPSLGIVGRSAPAYLCGSGIRRMAKEFYEISPSQYNVNVSYLKSLNNEFLTGVELLECVYNSLGESNK